MAYDLLMKRAGLALGPAAAALPRRSFLKLSVGSGFALGLYPLLPAAAADAAAPPAGLKPSEQPNAFLRVAADGTVTVVINRLDFGQGVNTALPMLVAEEMDADWKQVRYELAPAGDAYKDPNFGIQMVGGSNTMKASTTQYRELGARARAMFVAAAAERWKVAPASVSIDNGVITSGSNKASFGELAADAMKQPVPAKVTLKDPAKFRIAGRPVGRLDAAAKSSGRQDFGIDQRARVAPAAKVALIVRPPVFGAKLASFDATKAKQIKGVAEVLKIDLDRGATGLAVIADGYWPAKQAREALDVKWNADGLDKPDSDKLFEQYAALAKQPGLKARTADTSKIAGAAKKISAEYRFPYLAHAPMEPLNCLVDFRGDSCSVWVGSQFQTIDQASVAKTLGLKPEQVQFNTAMAGGGFGRRATPTSDYVIEAAQIAKAWRAAGGQGAVQTMWSREDDIKGGYYRPMHVHRAEIGLDAQGNVIGWQHTIVGQSILTGTPFEAFMVKNGIDGVMTEGVVDTPYALPLALDVHHPKVNVPVLWWRSVGNTHTAYVMETLIDEIARAGGKDPVAYRKELLGTKHPRITSALDLAVANSGYGKTKLPDGHAWGVAVHESFSSVVAYVVEASVENGEPRLHKVTAGVHCNYAVNPMTVEAQVQGAVLMAVGTTIDGAAITFKDGAVQQSNFSDYPVARFNQMPQVTVHIVPSSDPPTGMGEPGLPPLAPAYANAIAALTGKRLRELPFKMA